MTSLVLTQGKEIVECLGALLAPEHVLLGVSGHVLGDGDLQLEILAAQRAVVRLFHIFAAIVVSQLVNGGKDGGALCTLKGALLFIFWLYLYLFWGEKWLHFLLLVFIPVFDEAAAVLESEATFLAGKWRQVVLMRVEMAVEVEHFTTVELLSAVLAFQTRLFGLCRQVSDWRRCLLLFDIHCAIKLLLDSVGYPFVKSGLLVLSHLCHTHRLRLCILQGNTTAVWKKKDIK